MKPINLNKETCNPISSNCVIWQGPDIPCIKLCKGDTVSDVVFKLATELCQILDILDVQNYDLSCFNITACAPQNFNQLIQFLIEQICALQNIDSTDTDRTKAGCPDCLVTVEECFKNTFPTGSAQLLDYVTEMAKRICTNILQIGVIQNSIVTINNNIQDLQDQIDNLPTPSLPSFTPVCVISPPADTPIDIILQALEAQFCALIGVTGDDVALYNAVIAQCVADADPRKDGGGAMSSLPGWNSSPVSTIAEAITNLWLTVCDLRAQTLPTVAVTDTQTVDMTVTAGPNYSLSANVVDTGWVNMLGFQYYEAGNVAKPQCRRIGNVIHFRGTVIIPLSSTADNLTYQLLTNSAAYNSQAFPHVWAGVGDVLYGNGPQINTNGSLFFNNNSNCIPSSVWTGPTPLFDGTYSIGFQVATRPIDIDAFYGTSLSAAITVGITDSGVLFCGTVKDSEITTTRGSGILGASPLRLITSNIEAGQHIPSYIAESSNVHNVQTATSLGTGYISGTTFTVVTGTFYEGQKLFGSGVLEDTWLMEETTPGVFRINKSQTIGSAGPPVVAVSLKGIFPVTYSTEVETNAFSPAIVNNLTWPFSCDAAQERQIGGFQFRIDGLTAYIAP